MYTVFTIYAWFLMVCKACWHVILMLSKKNLAFLKFTKQWMCVYSTLTVNRRLNLQWLFLLFVILLQCTGTYLKGQSNEIFHPHFFQHSNLTGPLTNGFKYFRFWLRFRRIFRFFLNLPAVSYCAESVSLQYYTVGSHSRPREVNSHFLKLLHRPLKRQCHKNKCGFLFY